jgi:hypothetical protein
MNPKSGMERALSLRCGAATCCMYRKAELDEARTSIIYARIHPPHPPHPPHPHTHTHTGAHSTHTHTAHTQHTNSKHTAHTARRSWWWRRPQIYSAHTHTLTHTQHVPQGRAGGGADGDDAVTEAWGPKAAEKGAHARQGRADRPQKHGEGSRNAQLTGAENRVAAGVFLNILN